MKHTQVRSQGGGERSNHTP